MRATNGWRTTSALVKWVMEMPFVELFQAIVGIAVSLIPEGLPALITITLAMRCVMRLSAACRLSKRWARCHASAPTRPAP